MFIQTGIKINTVVNNEVIDILNYNCYGFRKLLICLRCEYNLIFTNSKILKNQNGSLVVIISKLPTDGFKLGNNNTIHGNDTSGIVTLISNTAKNYGITLVYGDYLGSCRGAVNSFAHIVNACLLVLIYDNIGRNSSFNLKREGFFNTVDVKSYFIIANSVAFQLYNTCFHVNEHLPIINSVACCFYFDKVKYCSIRKNIGKIEINGSCLFSRKDSAKLVAVSVYNLEGACKNLICGIGVLYLNVLCERVVHTRVALCALCYSIGGIVILGCAGDNNVL